MVTLNVPSHILRVARTAPGPVLLEPGPWHHVAEQLQEPLGQVRERLGIEGVGARAEVGKHAVHVVGLTHGLKSITGAYVFCSLQTARTRLAFKSSPSVPTPMRNSSFPLRDQLNQPMTKILRAKPRIAVDQTAASGEYCFNSGRGTMVHFATQPERTPEDVVYEFDPSGLVTAGLDTSRMQQLPDRGQMTPGVWYFLPKGQQDPHHGHAMANPTIAIAINIK